MELNNKPQKNIANEPNARTRAWFTVPIDELIIELGMPGLTAEFVPDICQLNPQKVADAVVEIARRDFEGEFTLVPIAALSPLQKDEHNIECVVVLGGQPEEIERLIIFNKSFEHLDRTPEIEPTKYERMKESAFNLMRRNKIRNFSAEELHRVFKHSKEQLLYTAIVRREVDDGFTIASLYEQDRDRGFER